MAKKSIKRNYIYSAFYEVLQVITPLITAPYLARVLDADGIGIVSFAESKVAYFTLFAVFGLTSFGQREISYVVDDIHKRSRVFFETLIFEMCTALLVIAVYLPFAFLQNEISLYLILGFQLLACAVDVTWFFQGMEEFGKIVLRNIVFKIINIAFVFTVIKTKNDLMWYAFELSFFIFLSNLSLWPYLPKYITKVKLKDLKPFRHMKTVFSLFIPTVAIKVYTVLDKTMIGVITKNDFENGYYEQGVKIAKMVLAIVTALGMVMIPRISYHFGKGEQGQIRNLMYRAFRFVWFISIPLCFGLIGISANLVPWFFGEGYDKVIPLLRILSFLVIIIGLSNVSGMQYLIPTKRQNSLTVSVVIGACVNFLLNCFLIRMYMSIGAALASVAAETVITAVQFYMIRKDLSIGKIISSCWHYLLAGSCMLLLLFFLNTLFTPSIIHTFIMIGSGAIVYFLVLILLRDSFCFENIKSILDKV